MITVYGAFLSTEWDENVNNQIKDISICTKDNWQKWFDLFDHHWIIKWSSSDFISTIISDLCDEPFSFVLKFLQCAWTILKYYDDDDDDDEIQMASSLSHHN